MGLLPWLEGAPSRTEVRYTLRFTFPLFTPGIGLRHRDMFSLISFYGGDKSLLILYKSLVAGTEMSHVNIWTGSGVYAVCVQWVPWAVVPASRGNLGVMMLCSLMMLSVFKIMCHQWWMDGWMNEWMNRTYWRNDTDRGKSEYSKRNLFHYHLVHHKSPIAWDWNWVLVVRGWWQECEADHIPSSAEVLI